MLVEYDFYTFFTRKLQLAAAGSSPSLATKKTGLSRKSGAFDITLDTYTDVFKKMDQSAVDKFDTYIEQV